MPYYRLLDDPRVLVLFRFKSTLQGHGKHLWVLNTSTVYNVIRISTHCSWTLFGTQILSLSFHPFQPHHPTSVLFYTARNYGPYATLQCQKHLVISPIVGIAFIHCPLAHFFVHIALLYSIFCISPDSHIPPVLKSSLLLGAFFSLMILQRFFKKSNLAQVS